MTKFWLTIGVVSFLFVGCADSASDADKQGETDVIEVVEEKATVEQVNVAAPSAGLNPAHGEPGHDCAIAVGAPLDGSGGQAQPTVLPTVSQPAAQPTLNVSAPTSGKLNPAHGEPGHDCAVAVGAPLPAK